MGLSNKKEEQLRAMPLVKAQTFRSKDGRFVVHRTTITDIKPVAYYDKVLSADAEVVDVSEELAA